jgi:glutamate synthase (NADPH/NADH) small chain
MTSPRESQLPDGRLEQRFEEKYPPLSFGGAAAEAARCLYCFDAPCMRACPTHIDIATFIKKIASDNVRGSARTILTANLLGASCAKVCPVEVLCEGACVYVGWGRKAISIGRLQRYAMDRGASPELLTKAPPSGRSIGLVGAGPASLACAGTLALLGHSPVIYERDDVPGGLNTTGVAPYKMDAQSALAEVDFIRALGVEIQTGVEIGRSLSGDELLRRHEAVFLGIGLGPDTPLTVPGAAGPGVFGAVEWIRRMKLDRAASLDGVQRAAVIGGGNTALDVARELRQLGVLDVRLVYRRSEAEMSGYRHEWESAKIEGVVLVPDALVREVVRERGKLAGLELVRAKDGRPTAERLETLRTDLAVVAIGQAKLAALAALFPGVAVDDSGCLVADRATGATANPRVFTGGDAMNGGKEVVHAAAEGQNAARAIDALLQRTPAQHTIGTSKHA